MAEQNTTTDAGPAVADLLDSLIQNHTDNKPEANPAAMAAMTDEAGEAQATAPQPDRADTPSDAKPSTPPQGDPAAGGSAPPPPPAGDTSAGGFPIIDGHTIQTKTFDPAIHCCREKDGSPKRKKDGTYQLKPEYHKKLKKWKQAGPAKAAQEAQAQSKRLEADAAARVLTESIIIGTRFLTLSDTPTTDAERSMMQSAWSEYLATKNVPLPDWMPPAIVTAGFVASRASEPQARSRMASIYNRGKAYAVSAVQYFTGRVLIWKSSKKHKAPKAAKNAHNHTRPNNDGQNVSKSTAGDGPSGLLARLRRAGSDA